MKPLNQNKMKTNELRFGNYVYDTLGKVNKIDLEAITYIAKEPHNQVKPIPLTEEWLLKFGFELEYSQLTNIYKYFLPNSPFGYSQGNFGVFTQTGCFSVELKYVHQLQNLYFALTGEEVTFKSE